MIDFLNKEVLQIAGYNVHVAFFILIAIIILLATVVILLLSKNSESGDYIKRGKNKIKITNWQKDNIGNFLIQERDSFVLNNEGEEDRDTGEKHIYIHLIDEFYNYLQEEKEWNPDKLMSIDENFLLVFNSILMDESKKQYINKDPNSALLIAHTIDLMNGGQYLYGLADEWIGSDVSEMIQHESMDVQEGRLFRKSTEAIYSLAGLMYTSEGVRRKNLPDYIDHITIDELDQAYFEIESATSFPGLSETTFDVLVYAFYNEIDSYLKRLSAGERLREFQLYDVRCLCSALDYTHETYDYILETIE